jgi:cytochrome b6-f complex iron-sulfur subunit
MILVTFIEPTRNSLAYASASVALISMLGWVIEARDIAGPAPAVEPEHHEEEEEEAPGPSYWPVALAVGIVGIAAGIVYEWEYGALIVAVPLAAAAAAAWGDVIRREMESEAIITPIGEPVSAAPISVGGRLLAPVPSRVLAAQAAGGAAIAIERVEGMQVSRRGVLRLAFWTGLGAGLLAIAASTVDFLYPRGITGFGGVVAAGSVDEYQPGTKTPKPEGRFWLVRLSEEEGAGFLALWWKCPHLGCTVPWRENFNFVDPTTGAESRGWFRCPCHGSTYNDAGVRVFGPAPRSMDRMAVTIDPNTGRISVNTGSVTKGTPDNANFAVKADG